MRLYLAGPMRGRESFNRTAFAYWAAHLRGQGHEVHSPWEHSASLFGSRVLDSANGDEECMNGDTLAISRTVLALDLQFICLHADIVAVMPGWEMSKGASAEFAVAKAIPIPVKNVEEVT